MSRSHLTGMPAAVAATESDRWLAALGLSVRLGLTQEELGRRASVSRVRVSSIERADHPASELAVRQVAAARGRTLTELVEVADRQAELLTGGGQQLSRQ